MVRNNQSKYSRRNVLRSAGAAGVGISTVGTASGKSTAEYVQELDIDIEVTEVTGEEREKAIVKAKKDDLESIEEHIERTKRVKMDWDSSTVLKVEKELGDSLRYVVSVPAKTESNETVFMQYNGFDMLDDPSEIEMAKSVPDSIGFVERDDIGTMNDTGGESTTLHVENGEIVAEKINSGVSTQGNNIPCCGGSSDCDTCMVERGVNCAPTMECAYQIAISVGGSLKACSSCANSPAWQICVWCALLAVGAGITGTNCLGCDGTETDCIPSDIASTVC